MRSEVPHIIAARTMKTLTTLNLRAVSRTSWIILLLLLTAVSNRAADADNDGLTDEIEATLVTNPNLADTDGDGVKDGLEVRAGTDPKLFSSLFKVAGVPTRTPNGWQITWNSIAGKSYRLQRLVGENLNAGASWADVQTVQANAFTASATDSDTGSTRRFYRIHLVESANQTSLKINEVTLVSDTLLTNETTIVTGAEVTIG